MGEGVTSNFKVEGNSKVIHHFTSYGTDLFPILKAVKSGEVNLKLKHP